MYSGHLPEENHSDSCIGHVVELLGSVSDAVYGILHGLSRIASGCLALDLLQLDNVHMRDGAVLRRPRHSNAAHETLTWKKINFRRTLGAYCTLRKPASTETVAVRSKS